MAISTATLLGWVVASAAPAHAHFLQTDPIGYADQMNLYAYANNDPVNFRDPSGLAICGSSLRGSKDCTSALDDADKARDDSRAAAEVISSIAEKVSNGETLTDAEQSIVDAVTDRFGESFSSAKNLARVATGLTNIANRIGERGQGAILQRGDNKVSSRLNEVPRAYTTPGNKYTINLNNDFIDDTNSTARSKTLVHEAAHLTGQFQDFYFDRRGPLNARFQLRMQGNLPYNADSYACVIPGYCP